MYIYIAVKVYSLLPEIMNSAHIWSSNTVKTGTERRSFMAEILRFVVKDSRNLIAEMWSMENGPGMILALNRPLTSYHIVYLL